MESRLFFGGSLMTLSTTKRAASDELARRDSNAARHLVIRASAGTGKTYQLSNRYLSLISQDVPPEQILASTFTRKAAGEILERVLQRLAKAALDTGECRKLGEAIGQEGFTIQQSRTKLRQVVHTLHRLRISTLDSFFAQLAGSFSLELDFPPGWSIVEGQQDLLLRHEAIETVLSSDDHHEVSRLLNLMTKGEATRSIGQLMQDTVDNLYSLFQQTGEAAWRNFPSHPLLTEQQVADVARELADADLPSDKRFEKARNESIDAALTGDWETFLSKGLAGKVLEGETTYCRKPIPEDVCRLYQKLLAHARGLFLKQLEHQTGATYDLLARFDHVYRQRKAASRALRFEDVTQRLADSPLLESLGRIDFRLDGDIAHLLLDEFQDTSFWQWRVLEPFARRVTAAARGARRSGTQSRSSFFCVGDVKQAIYGWRGGRSEIFEAIEGRLEGLTRNSLTASYRSARPVIEAVNQIFQNLDQHPHLEREAMAVEAWSGRFEKHTTVHENLPGYVTLETSAAADKNKAEQTLIHAADRVAELVREAPGRKIGVLVRRNVSVARMIFELKQRNVPASEEGGNPLTDSAAVLAMLALLKLLDHPADRVARFHVARSPLGPPLGLVDWHDQAQAAELARRLRDQLMDEGYGRSLRAWSRPVLPLCSRRDASRLRQLVQIAYDYDAEVTLRTVDFIEFVEMQRVADPAPTDVRVMTVHQAKGLQFEIVVLADLEFSLVGQPSAYVVQQTDVAAPVERVCIYRNEQIQKLLPVEFQQMFARGIDLKVLETLCVLYVATTRAVRAMHIVIAPASKSEKNLPKTAAGLLRATLAADDPAEELSILYCKGDRDWHRRDAAAPWAEARRVALPERIEFARDDSNSQPLQRSAPSELEGGLHVPLRGALRLSNRESLTRGTVIHAWFQQVTWLEEGLPERAGLVTTAAEHISDMRDIELLADHFQKLLELPAVRGLLNRARYVPGSGAGGSGRPGSGAIGSLDVVVDDVEVHNERPFAVRLESRLLSGTIDRLVLLKSGGRVVGAEIVDYKTDRVVEGDGSGERSLEDAAEYYRPQQEAYRSAVARLYRLDEAAIRLQLLFLHPGLVREL
jgi:ATP-dependent helicase/nuclease subunit A